ncbi:anti-sigma factor family protein [Azospirillum agricola]|uniref:anti-sigma factor family protein n=1 Tax=Azospirillum agricola TaxID=1720247 RepID=UPI000A0F1BF6|nr:hypothetical protein [Azospirillum agricola]SMH36548.1 Transmembrane transcriptional regulator (anti-sigma factor RsiW) [Azospirillum lipoferum]
MPSPILEADLLAYVDDQLDPARRIEVEAYLQANPVLAARVMQDLRQRDEIRLFLHGDAVRETADEPAPSPAPAAAPAAANQRGRHPPRRLRMALTAAALVGIGWTAHTLVGNVLIDPVAAAHPIPVFADEAVEAYRTAVTAGSADLGMAPENSSGLAKVISRAVGASLPIPTFPERLIPLVSRIVPWDEGSAVQVVYTTTEFERVTLFAADDDRFAVTAPEAAILNGVSVVYWRQGHHVYALCADLPPDTLLTLAEAAHASWF